MSTFSVHAMGGKIPAAAAAGVGSYIADSYANTGSTDSASTISITAPSAAVIGDVFLATILGDKSDSPTVLLTSPNISWALAVNVDHSGNSEICRVYRGIVTTGFSANTELITATFSTGVSYRNLDISAFHSTTGFATEPVNIAEGTVWANHQPTGTDGVTQTITTTGSNKFIIVGLATFEDFETGSSGFTTAGTGCTLISSGNMFGLNTNSTAVEYKLVNTSGSTTIAFTHTNSAAYGVSIAAVALEINP